jgi:hypothetical protein
MRVPSSGAAPDQVGKTYGSSEGHAGRSSQPGKWLLVPDNAQAADVFDLIASGAFVACKVLLSKIRSYPATDALPRPC